MKNKVGDTVRIQSREWIEAQEKIKIRYIDGLEGNCIRGREDNHGGLMEPYHFKYAGRLAKITAFSDTLNYYRLDIDDGQWFWGDWMFDSEDKLLREAVKKLLPKPKAGKKEKTK
jgi:hypothetical protein